MVKNLPANAASSSISMEILWRRKWQPTPGFLMGSIPLTKEPGGTQYMGLKESNRTKHTYTWTIYFQKDTQRKSVHRPWTNDVRRGLRPLLEVSAYMLSILNPPEIFPVPSGCNVSTWVP